MAFQQITENVFLSEISRKACKQFQLFCDCHTTEKEIQNGQLGCQENCKNRLFFVECTADCACGQNCSNQRFQRREYANLQVFETGGKGLGVRANSDIAADTFIIEYVGEVLDKKQVEDQVAMQAKRKDVHSYFMGLNHNAIIDASKKGNFSRYLNHSCDPNAEAQKWIVNGELRVGIFSRKAIKAGEEISIDYQFVNFGENKLCLCGATNCRN